MTRLFFLCFMVPNFIFAEGLCGPEDAQVCLSSSMGFNLTLSGGELSPGSTLVLCLPGLEFADSPGVTGTAEVAYRFGGAGSMSCTSHSDLIINPLAEIAQDDQGITAVSFTIANQSMLPGESFQFLVQDLQVCQKVSDGPASVFVQYGMYLISGKNKVALQSSGARKMNDWFTLCTSFSGALPYFSPQQRLFLTNPYAQAVSYHLDGASTSIPAHARQELPSSLAGKAIQYDSPLELPLLIFEEGEDIDVETLSTADHSDYLIPHIARDTAVWRNVFQLANSELLSLRWTRGDETGGRLLDPGLTSLDPDSESQDGASWMRLHGALPFQGYYAFSRKNAAGSAFVNAARLESNNRSGWTLAYLPHVAADRVNFWTGYSLANASDQTAMLEWRAVSSTGETLIEESELAAGANEIGLLFKDRFASASDISWIEIRSNIPLTGLELLGGNRSTQFSGILLPHQTGANLNFPFLFVDETHWSGISLINTSSESRACVLTYRNQDGTSMAQESFTLEPLRKRLFLAPAGASHAEVSGQNLIGFAAIGQGTTKIGAYEAKPTE